MKKSVTIDEDKNEVYLLVKWAFAYREARKSNYQQQFADRIRFRDRIMFCEKILSPLFDVAHRTKIYVDRFHV